MTNCYDSCQIWRFYFKLTWDIYQPEDKKLIELREFVWDGLQDNGFGVFPGSECDRATGICKLLLVFQRCHRVVGKQLPEDGDIPKMSPCS